MDDFTLRSVFADICRGYSAASWGKRPVFIKHFSHFEQLELERDKKIHFDAARARGIETRDLKIKWLNKEGIWTIEDEKKLIQADSYAKNLKKTRDKAAIKSQIDALQKQLEEAQAVYYKLSSRKEALVGLTAESYADQKMQNAYVFLSFYADSACKERLFTEKQFKKLEEEEIYELLDLYILHINLFTQDALRRISISDFFTNYFDLTEDITKFYGKSIIDFTFYQVNLARYGSYFKRIFANHEIPDRISDSPDEIEQYVLRLQNKKNMRLPTEGRVGVIGATKEGDGEFFGGEENYINDLIKKGGVNDIFDAHQKSKK